MTAPQQPEGITREGLELMASIMERSMAATQATTRRIEDGYRYEIITAIATLRAVIEQVSELFSGPYLPSPFMVMQALHTPDMEMVEGAAARYASERGWNRFTGELMHQ